MRHDNPLGTDGFEFVEFTVAEPDDLKARFQAMGFVVAGRHRARRVLRLRQGDISILLNMEPAGHAARFRALHGPSVSAIAFRVEDAAKALDVAVGRGATKMPPQPCETAFDIPAIEGIGGSCLYLVDRHGSATIYDDDFVPVEEGRAGAATPVLDGLDHLTHNVRRGQMARWAEFYERIFAFREIRYFDIKGRQTGLVSKALVSPCGKIRIPINESQDDDSQIEEFIALYRGEGVQHLAFATHDIFAAVEAMRARGVAFQETPDTYYEQLGARVPGHGQDPLRLRADHILVDGDPAQGRGLLLQIFTETMAGPIFFELIERRGNEGFGEGNFQALFEALELDQIRRGVLPAIAAKA